MQTFIFLFKETKSYEKHRKVIYIKKYITTLFRRIFSKSFLIQTKFSSIVGTTLYLICISN